MIAITRQTRRLACKLTIVVLLCCPSMQAHGQSDTITANPKAVLLHRIWMLRGSVLGQEQVGDAAGGIGDIDGDGKTEFAVAVGKLGQWRVFAGHDSAPGSQPIWQLATRLNFPLYPVVGDFWGTGHKAVGFGTRFHDTANHTTEDYPQIKVFRTESGKLPDTPSAVFYPRKTLTIPVQLAYNDVLVGDLDGDGADELIVAIYDLRRNNIESQNAELWIFKGGPDFQLDTPTVVVRDPEANNSYNFLTAIGDVDHDGHPDILTGVRYPTGIKMKIYWGEADALARWSSTPPQIRTIPLDYTTDPDIAYGFTLLDCDGDGLTDLVLPRVRPNDRRVLLYRGGHGKDFRTRSLSLADADGSWSSSWSGASFIPVASGGHLNGGKYDMLMMSGISPYNASSTALIGLNGGPDGPDQQYDAYYDPTLDGLIEGDVTGLGHPIGDCNGDGWPDYLTADPSWYGNEAGIALVLAGGPYIPRDSASSSIRDIAVAGVRNAVSVWPVPTRDELHIAWRGDLKQMPAQFEVHDVLGRQIASGNVESWRGEALWQCAGVPSGAYLISMFDDHGALITTMRVVKQ